MSIQVDQLNYEYMPGTPFEVHALKNVRFTLGDGEFAGVIGHTGCGKSTLIQLMAGLMKPTSGTVLVDGEDINQSSYDRKKLRRTVGVVFQYPEYQLFEETVEKDVAFGPLKIGMTEEETAQAVDYALTTVGFTDIERIKKTSPFDLSGGQKRKAAIAGVLAMRPSVLILDEPIAGLDPEGREQFMRLLASLNGAGTTIFMISHSMDGLCEYASRILVMNRGELIMDGAPREVFADVERLKNAGLDVGEARKIGYLLNKRGFFIPDDAVTKSDLLAAIVRQIGKEES